ncbi:DUF262 domain-containing protein [Methylobacterium sp. J-090]|uniref:DUF262 domain-containing protein n=1 Tax=Methylobacterium sp. J-090 TaxID=2836666 RepID=UPI001FB8F512|nr:DUF262 domain-containing protein [Methylobacterium sp. J-090]MCJ2081695.1 DUF262 domain-containing protein [Methylobacterium sp. J-090]
MDAKDHPVISVLGDQRRFMVPIYQRQYSWREPRLAPFWDDVVAKAEEVVGGKPKFSHYMGALILAPGGDGFTIGSTPRVQVVDGQQRLTTFQLFLAALREVGERLGKPELSAMVHNYLYVPTMYGDKEADSKFRLVPTPEDKPVFHLIVEGGLEGVRAKHPTWFYQNGNLIKGSAPNAVRALDFFIGRIETYVRFGLLDDDEQPASAEDEGEEAPHHRLQALLQALLNHLKLVVITLSENDDAQVIFETLNSQAEPLLAMDLVRNNIFHRATSQGESVEALFEAKWRPFDEDRLFWKADSPRAKPKRPRIDHFLSHALTAQTGEETSLRELYAEYRAFTRPKGKPRFATVEEELDALVIYSPIYRTLETGGGDEVLNRLGSKLNLWEVSTAYPLVFRIAVANVDPDEKLKIYNLIYSYLVRRAICGLTPKGLNKTFARLIQSVMSDGVSVETIARAFSTQRSDTVRFPADREFRDAIRSKPVYEMIKRKERLADILWELECASRTKYSVYSSKPENMSVEHVLPQTWSTHWPLNGNKMIPADKVSGLDEDTLAEIRARDYALQTLGNLTLITVPGNTSASNKAFAEKKIWLKQSLLALNLSIIARDEWDEAAIVQRADELGSLAIMLWPAPPQHVESVETTQIGG